MDYSAGKRGEIEGRLGFLLVEGAGGTAVGAATEC